MSPWTGLGRRSWRLLPIVTATAASRPPVPLAGPPPPRPGTASYRPPPSSASSTGALPRSGRWASVAGRKNRALPPRPLCCRRRGFAPPRPGAWSSARREWASLGPRCCPPATAGCLEAPQGTRATARGRRCGQGGRTEIWAAASTQSGRSGSSWTESARSSCARSEPLPPGTTASCSTILAVGGRAEVRWRRPRVSAQRWQYVVATQRTRHWQRQSHQGICRWAGRPSAPRPCHGPRGRWLPRSAPWGCRPGRGRGVALALA
mmetsp:Transcript_126527/g.369717  ORF Transcript_126527/g.369717 Transcript_126527/m.369717 type:complete len:263 (-) Transcript_126527:207-995(-)